MEEFGPSGEQKTPRSITDFVRREGGIRCPTCGAEGCWSVYYTRQVADGVGRVRHCRKCGAIVRTREHVVGAPADPPAAAEPPPGD